MTANKWVALERVGEWAGLDKEDLEDFVIRAISKYNSEIEGRNFTEDFNHEYMDFLNQNVFSSDEVVEFIESKDVPESRTSLFKSGEIPIEDTFHERHFVKRSFDEIVDLLMLLRFIYDYSEESSEGCVPSRYHLQKSIYLINFRLAGEPQYSVSRRLTKDLGLLEKTGFRYSYKKRSSGPYSTDLMFQLSELVSTGLVTETLIEDGSTNEISEQTHHYRIQLTDTAQILMDRFDELFATTVLPLLTDWDSTQKEVIELVSNSSVSEIEQMIRNQTHVTEYEKSATLLTGRLTKFEQTGEIPAISAFEGVMSNA